MEHCDKIFNEFLVKIWNKKSPSIIDIPIIIKEIQTLVMVQFNRYKNKISPKEVDQQKFD
jgi:hypothetical protein